ncbi:ribosome biogenesis GTPase Der [Ruficoccus sp. ZRK36]|uniref:ribosome biogenesis GTPase Der n=1 Tax=Ruficoccus sp. ZRK36 TaxID=2866311 RepID=UPI001C734BEC|nr:ribosome biogenesis GTPase Der [Ruficoccus sp. ZRK36]QYY34716.1 ribosome biogenesis GTPase Der [Ruficoccus sp. ZRK36]
MNLERSVALVGRPNVGKSRIFNRLVGRRVAIVHDMPGVTRDLATEMVAEGGYMLMDTGGIGIKPEMTPEMIHAATEEQADFAIQAATLVLFVVDASEGMTTVDEDLANQLRRYNKPTILVMNKMDRQGSSTHQLEFTPLGFKPACGVSAEHGTGFDRLKDAILKILGPKPKTDESEKNEPRRTRICLAGKPNVGKSSLGNRLLNSDRLIVSEVAGTTRDSIEADLDYTAEDGKVMHFRLVDTAGLKPKRKLGSSLDYFSTIRSEEAIRRSDIVFLVLDAMTGVTKHDKKLAGEILEAGVGLVMVVNKWDYARDAFRRDPPKGYETESDFRKVFIEAVRKELFFLPDSPVIFTSALENFRVGDILKQAAVVHKTLARDLPTGPMNRLLKELFERRAPRLVGGKRFKIYYAVQTGHRPFRIRLFCNSEERFDDNYRRYLESSFQKEFQLSGCPIRFELVGKPDSNRKELSITEYRRQGHRKPRRKKKQ